MQAIGVSNNTANGVGPDASRGVLESQLSRYQIQLADWCACPSGKTPAGKEKIQDLQNKVDTVKARLDRIETVKAQRQSSAVPATQGSTQGASGNSSMATVDNPGDLQFSSTRGSAVTAMGGLVDVFA
jgi:hypothetical protein